MKYISIIESHYPNFSKQEKKIADYFLKEKRTIATMSLQEITSKTKVSNATIVRFVRKIGYKGFPEFKFEVAKEFNEKEIEENSSSYIDNIAININRTIQGTKELIEEEKINKSIELIERASKIYFFGLGSSGVVAKEFQNKFMRLGKTSICAGDNHFQIMYASNSTKEDLIIVISLSGETNELFYPLTIARERGCKIIAVTNYIMSTVAKLSDIVLVTAGRESVINGGSLISKISQLYLLDILSTGYSLKNRKVVTEIKNTIALAIANKK